MRSFLVLILALALLASHAVADGVVVAGNICTVNSDCANSGQVCCADVTSVVGGVTTT